MSLTRWDGSLKTKVFLRDIYSQDRFFDDMSAYVEELFQEHPDSQALYDEIQTYIVDFEKNKDFAKFFKETNDESLKGSIDLTEQKIPLEALIGLKDFGALNKEEEAVFNKALEERIIRPSRDSFYVVL